MIVLRDFIFPFRPSFMLGNVLLLLHVQPIFCFDKLCLITLLRGQYEGAEQLWIQYSALPGRGTKLSTVMTRCGFILGCDGFIICHTTVSIWRCSRVLNV